MTAILKNNKGFTLLEVMIALTIVAIVFVPLLALRNQNINQTAYARQLLRAEFLANGKISKLLLEETPLKGETHGEFGDPYPEFRWVQTISDTPLGAVREVKLKVIWKRGERDEEMEWVQFVRQSE